MEQKQVYPDNDQQLVRPAALRIAEWPGGNRANFFIHSKGYHSAFYGARKFYRERVSHMRNEKISLGVTLDSDLVEALRRLAKEDSRSLPRYINIILKRYYRNMPLAASMAVMKKNVSSKVSINLCLDRDVAEKAKYFAQTEERSVSQYINRFLRQYLENME